MKQIPKQASIIFITAVIILSCFFDVGNEPTTAPKKYCIVLKTNYVSLNKNSKLKQLFNEPVSSRCDTPLLTKSVVHFARSFHFIPPLSKFDVWSKATFF